MKVNYRVSQRGYRTGTFRKSGFAFVVTNHTKMTHRVRSVDDRGLIYVRTYCGCVLYLKKPNGDDRGEIIAKPPKERLVCEVCENNAVKLGELSASKIVGKHVHLGKLVPRQICCQGKKASN